ncbi:MAG: HlyD family efflux transporter periplasmic adaptor subunit [bacterium]|nr:HlyD family efflux transporter periplasmic adaptor subunit [bacterium]
MSEEKKKQIDDIGEDITEQLQAIEIRSEEVQEIMGFIPHWIIRWGITILFLVIFFVMVGSYFFQYPDVIMSEIVLTTENPPATLVARGNGKIAALFVEDNQAVKTGDFIAVIENATDYRHLLELKKKLAEWESFFTYFETSPPPDLTFDKNYSLGELQPSYASFLKSDADYRHFIRLDFHRKKIDSIKMQISQRNILARQMKRQTDIMEEELELSRKQYERSVNLHKENIVSQKDFESAKSTFLQKSYAHEGAKSALANSELQLSQLKQSILDLELQAIGDKNRLELALSQNYENLTGRISQWEQSFLLKAPIDGKVTFTAYWSINQNVKAGDRFVTIIPENAGSIFGRVVLPMEGSGKVKIGQHVNIKLINFPHMDFGMLTGVVKSKSLVAADNFYTLEVELPNKLITSYGKPLEFQQEMKGIAEIITEDSRLLERILKPIKAMMDKM